VTDVIDDIQALGLRERAASGGVARSQTVGGVQAGGLIEGLIAERVSHESLGLGVGIPKSLLGRFPRVADFDFG